MDDSQELLELAAELRASDPDLSIDQSLDAAAIMLQELQPDLADWEARRDAMIARLENYTEQWDRLCTAARSARSATGDTHAEL